MKETGFRKFFSSFFSSFFLILIAIIILLKIFFIESREVASGSMSDTINHGDYILGWKLNFRKSSLPGYGSINGIIDRKDIVLFQVPGEKEILIKRIIGLPGESVRLSPTGISINGVQLSEHYIRGRPGFSGDITYQVPPDMYFVLGDNRTASRDSRTFGFIGITDMKAKVFLRYYPINKLKWFD